MDLDAERVEWVPGQLDLLALPGALDGEWACGFCQGEGCDWCWHCTEVAA